MDLTPDSEQDSFLVATTDWCRDNMPLEQARTRPEDVWQRMEEMGWLGMTAAGMSLDHATETLVFAELGRHLAPVGAIATAVGRRWDEDRRYALAIPGEDALRLIDSEHADAAIGIWASGPGIVAVPDHLAAGPGLDPSASLAKSDPVVKRSTAIAQGAALHLQLLAAAYAVGCADAARDMAATYAGIREQFERPIGWFQALKHLCADMAVRSAVARSQLYYAACALDADEPDAVFHVASAKHLADQAAIDNARANIQVHGGIGMTDEAYPHFCLKRAHLLSFIAPAQRHVLLGETE